MASTHKYTYTHNIVLAYIYLYIRNAKLWNWFDKSVFNFWVGLTVDEIFWQSKQNLYTTNILKQYKTKEKTQKQNQQIVYMRISSDKYTASCEFECVYIYK